MMDDRSVFHIISDLINEQGISCILIGGFAINYYKVTRQTADVDFLITKEGFNKIFKYLEEAGYKKNSLQENFVQLQNSHALMDVDFMFVDQKTIEKILSEGKKIKIVGQAFTVPSLYHLIALKLHSIKFNPKVRLTKDFPDIVNLIRINDVDFKERKFKELCFTYGTEEIYNRILEAFK
ncbi:MAG: nucleotidyltransferase [Candidatus Omnitrophica bacterium]|nr:nucleotidyltransferase [Candidatus Omnitrophota bacterium]MDE2221597.1 nucleotidyltransferase [Candidatus Omnitrophota bacterium]